MSLKGQEQTCDLLLRRCVCGWTRSIATCARQSTSELESSALSKLVVFIAPCLIPCLCLATATYIRPIDSLFPVNWVLYF